MSYPRIIVLLIVILVFAGCGVSGVTSENDRGDSVTNQGGKGTGNVAGVKIEVLGLEQKNAAVTYSVNIVRGTDETTESHHWEIEFGEVKLIMERGGDGLVSLAIDGRQYGSVAEDDELLVDVDRKIFVNGQERPAR